MKRTRARRLAWIGGMATSLCAAALVASLVGDWMWSGYLGRVHVTLRFGHAAIGVGVASNPFVAGPPPAGRGPEGWTSSEPWSWLNWPWSPWRPIARRETNARNGNTLHLVVLPLWIPLALTIMPTSFLIRATRRPRPGSCPACGYDLSGTAGGVCPECGVRNTG